MIATYDVDKFHYKSKKLDFRFPFFLLYHYWFHSIIIPSWGGEVFKCKCNKFSLQKLKIKNKIMHSSHFWVVEQWLKKKKKGKTQ